ncbi:PD-(D/E)XK nuclease-like domain-containing protein [Secundilactobacillus kimchicus]|uniref:PD-(D/E)XK nuclease-like domain-containing protein n=1 Tax=Secundilactobacillus kimchicus TaxID=528209 RepID=UPI0024A8523A|nr:PD-(D/E)XK nuclease-like domain-containing protein [Secundilactobacillus kimchicus]
MQNLQVKPSKTSSTASTKPLSTLTASNYYDVATDWQYLSPTVYKRFLTCEAEALAEMKGDYVPDNDTTPLLVGNYLHSYFESSKAHEKFVEAHKDKMLSSRAPHGLLKDYKVADSMIATLEDDEMFRRVYQGQKEQIVTGKIAGVPWKGKVDCLNLDNGYFVDLKTTQDLHKRFWDSESRTWVSFVTEQNYQLQMAVYRELIKQTFGVDCQPIIIAVTKQDPPDKAALSIPDEDLAWAMSEIEIHQEHVLQVMNGEVEPKRCEHCDYCRSTKHLGNIISIDDLID